LRGWQLRDLGVDLRVLLIVKPGLKVDGVRGGHVISGACVRLGAAKGRPMGMGEGLGTAKGLKLAYIIIYCR
jgi:hypothetical protein